MTQRETPTSTINVMPEHQQDAMARTLISCISRLFENPTIKADYERWKREKNKKMKEIKQ